MPSTNSRPPIASLPPSAFLPICVLPHSALARVQGTSTSFVSPAGPTRRGSSQSLQSHALPRLPEVTTSHRLVAPVMSASTATEPFSTIPLVYTSFASLRSSAEIEAATLYALQSFVSRFSIHHKASGRTSFGPASASVAISSAADRS